MTSDKLNPPTEGKLDFYWVTVMGLHIRVATYLPDNFAAEGEQSTPLLILNGIGAGVEILYPFLAQIKHRQVIVFDMPGAGRSNPPLLPWGMKRYAKLTLRVLKQFGFTRVDVLGLSWGGALAQQFARQFPERVRKLVLCATTPGSSMLPSKPTTMFRMLSPRRYLDKDYMARIAGDLYGGQLRKDQAFADEYASKAHSTNKRGYYYQVFAIASWSSLHWLHKLSLPTMVIHGTDDPIIPSANARVLASRIQDAQLWLIDGGHLFLLTLASDVTPKIEAFLG